MCTSEEKVSVRLGSLSHTSKEENFNRWEETPGMWNRMCKDEIICLNCTNLSFLLGGNMFKLQ